MAISSYNVVLKTFSTTAGDYKELVAVKDFPDLGSAPDTIEVTTLRDKTKRYIQGLQDTGSFEFTYNYTRTDFERVKDLDDNAPHLFELDFGNDGAGGEGSFYFSGQVSTYVSGAGTGAVVEAKIIVTCDSEVKIEKPKPSA